MRHLTITILFILFSIVCHAQVTVKMKREGGVSTIPCKVNGLNLKFIFDTGASDVSISMTEASFMLKNDYLQSSDIIGKSNYVDANGNINVGVNLILREIEIGGLKLFNVKASVVNNLKAPLLLGQSAISKLGVVQLDLENNTLTILNQPDSLQKNLLFENPADSITESDIKKADPLGILNIIDQANNEFNNGNYLEAITICTQLISENSKDKEAYKTRALSYDYLEDYKSAIKDYTKLIEINPKDNIAYSYRGKSKYDLEDYIGAIADLNKAIIIESKHLLSYLWRAETKDKMKNYSGAILDYDKAIALSPKDSSIYVSRAWIKYTLKDFKGAILDCNKALNILDTYTEALHVRALSKKGLNDFSGALTDFNECLEINSELSFVYAQRGLIKEHYEDYDGALEDYNRALDLDSEDFFASIYKSLLEKKMKENIWIKTYESRTGDKWYIANSIVSKGNSSIKIWIKNELKKAIKSNGKNVTINNGFELMLYYFDCKKKEYKLLDFKRYNSKGDSITIPYFVEDYSWKNIVPGTILELLLEKTCQLYN